MSPFPVHRGTTIYREIGIDTFPAQIETRGSRFLGGFSVFLGFSMSVLPAIGLLMALVKEGWSQDLKEGTAWFAPVAVLGLWLIWWGVAQWRQRLTIEMDGQEVRWRRRSIRGTREESAPLSEFDGIRGSDRWQSGYGALWELHLQHRDAEKCVLLYKANRPAGFDEHWKAYCHAFRQRPIEYLTPEEPFSRDVNDVGRSILALIAEGSLQLPDPGPAPDDIRVERADGRTFVHVGRKYVLSVSPRGLTRGSSSDVQYPADSMDAITVELGRPPHPRPWLRLAHRTSYASDSGAPTVFMRSDCLAEGLPIPTLTWLQRFLLRELAGPNTATDRQ